MVDPYPANGTFVAADAGAQVGVLDITGRTVVKWPSVSIMPGQTIERHVTYNVIPSKTVIHQSIIRAGADGEIETNTVSHPVDQTQHLADTEPWLPKDVYKRQTKKTSVYDAPFESETERVARVASVLDQISTGIWEVPGSEYETYDYTYQGEPVVWDADGNYVLPGLGPTDEQGNPTGLVCSRDAYGNVVDPDGYAVDGFAFKRRPAGENEANEIESQLRLFMYARIASDDTGAHGNIYDEQNGSEYTDHENFALAGTDADRDYNYGEDDVDWFGDSTDYNTADQSQGTWIQIGDANGYSIADKQNVKISARSFMTAHPGYEVRQIRWVVKAVPQKADGSYDPVSYTHLARLVLLRGGPALRGCYSNQRHRHHH